MRKYVFIILLIFAAILSACGGDEAYSGNAPSFTVINHEEAAEMMLLDNVLLLDVRTQQEFESGHIPGFINLPVNRILLDISHIAEDFEQHIIVICQTGRRSREAATALVNLGYWQVFDMGDIVSWDGEVVTEDVP